MLVPPILWLWQAAETSTLTERLLTKGISDFVILSFILFCIGVAGVLSRRNILIIFMSIELVLNAANLNFIAFTRYWQSMGHLSENMGQIFTIFVIVVAAAEAVIGLGIVITLYRNRQTISIDEIDLLKW